MEKEKHPGDSWQYILPCAFFDGENSFLSAIQGWEKILTKDIVRGETNYFERRTAGTAVPEERWAIERIFFHEGGNILAMTFDILDNGISYMIWWIRGNKERKFGIAIRTGDKWRVIGKDEALLKDFEAEESGGVMQVKRVCLKIIRKSDGKPAASAMISRSS